METKYKQNNVLYLVRGTAFSKCIVEEIIIHYTQQNIVIKYIVRPYGSDVKNCIPMNENELVTTLEEAKEIVVKCLTDNYNRSLENIKNTTNELFDNLETKYQLEQTITEEK